ncbi:MAG TPA: heme o synthase [Methylophilaceae bacterium]|jgi:protoheme IX farnesyltransferase
MNISTTSDMASNFQKFTVNCRSFFLLCKPRVSALIVFTAIIGMFLATPGMVPLNILLAATVGIALSSGAAAAFNCLIEQEIDARMARTRARPLPTGQVTSGQTLVFATIVACTGLGILYYYVNPLTMWLTFGTFLGYAVIYTIFLKPATPLNIVIGGASGAMPPILGWAAVNNTVSPEAMILFLIIFAWTPPHFWALALYRRGEYAKSGLPMLPVTHGEEFTRLQILYYTLILIAVTLIPAAMGMSGWIYLAAIIALDARFLWYAINIHRNYSDDLAKRAFRFSIWFLTWLFAVLLVDHYFHFPI